MKNSLRIQSALMILPHLFLFLLLLWMAVVCLEQIQQVADGISGEMGERVILPGNLDQMKTLMWSAIALTTAIGFVIPWLFCRWFINPILSIRNTIRQVCRGDLEARVQVESGNELQSLANEFNRMMEIRKQEQEQLLGCNRTLSGISACRHVMIHQSDEKRLIQECCQVLVDIGAYRMASVTYAVDHAHVTATLSAPAGYHRGDTHGFSASCPETALSPSARAIRNRHSAIISNVFGDPLFAPLQAEATRHGYASIMALPLSINQQILGALTLYAEKADAFGTEDVRLLTELADDLAHRVGAIRYFAS